jgi:aminobutyraldehyde dehydrogenase
MKEILAMETEPCPPNCSSTAPSCAGEGEAERVLNPATGGLLVECRRLRPNRCTRRCRRPIAPSTAGAHDADGRAGAAAEAGRRIEDEAEAFARLESLNCGKPYARALGDEIPAVADVFRFFAGACRTLTGPLAGEYLAGHTSMIRRDPVGVVARSRPGTTR